MLLKTLDESCAHLELFYPPRTRSVSKTNEIYEKEFDKIINLDKKKNFNKVITKIILNSFNKIISYKLW